MKAYVHTFGCKVNTYESEYIVEKLQEEGYEVIDRLIPDLNLVIVNTCTVTDNSAKKCLSFLKRVKKTTPSAILVAMGCFVQGTKDKIPADILIGNSKKKEVLNFVKEFDGKIMDLREDIKNFTFEEMNLSYFFKRTRAFVKIQDGCSSFCSYCAIPLVRGRTRSRKLENIILEINELLENGYKEIVLTGIHLGKYGLDLNLTFLDLLKEIEKIDLPFRIRISSIEINELTDEVINFLKTSKKVVPHLHIPLQSGSSKVLKKMNRKYEQKEFLDRISLLKKAIPELVISTDVMVGHPFEEEEDFLETVKVIQEVRFAKLHVFPYSKRENTPSSLMEQVEEDVKKKRVKRLLNLNKLMEEEALKHQVGKVLNVLIETQDNVFSYGHAECFHMVKVRGKYQQNEILKLEIKDFSYPYLIGEVRVSTKL